MPEELEQANQAEAKDTRLRRLGHNLFKLAAVASSAIAFEAVIPGTSLAQSSRGKEVAAATQPKTAENQLGGSKEVTAQQIERQRDSTVKIAEVFRSGNQVQYINELCSGVKVNIGGQSFVLTSNHCFRGLTHAYNGIIKGSKNGPKAADIYQLSQNMGHDAGGARMHMDIEILDAQTPAMYGSTVVREARPVGRATGIAVSLEGLDIALVQVAPEKIAPVTAVGPDGRAKTFTPRAWDKIKSVPYKQALAPPKRGQEAVVFGVPDYSLDGHGGKECGAIGTVMGQIKIDYGGERLVDVVAVKAKPGENPGYGGGSGGGGTAADGHTFGSLTEGIDLVTVPRGSTLSAQKTYWHEIESQLGFRIPKAKYNALELFSVPNRSTISSLDKAFGKNISPQALNALIKE